MSTKANKPTISVIVPIFNQELYLPQCLDSIKNQSFKDFEVLLVDDHSDDSSVEICRRYCADDPRFKLLINDANHGVSYSRNVAMRKASGAYFAFVDSDDYVSPNYLEKLAKSASTSDMPICEIAFAFRDKKQPDVIPDEINPERLRNDLEIANISGYLVTKLYKASVIRSNKLCFNEAFPLLEDLLFNLQYMKFIRTIDCIREPLYYYRMRRGSAVRTSKNLGALYEIEKIFTESGRDASFANYLILRQQILSLKKQPDFNERFKSFRSSRSLFPRAKRMLVSLGRISPRLALIIHSLTRQKGKLYD